MNRDKLPTVELELLAAFMDSLKDPFLFADTQHVTRYMNKAAMAHYDDGEALVGRSLLDCHNERSGQIIKEVLAAFEAGEDERLISQDEKRRIYMRVVRDTNGHVLGYYERYESLISDVPPRPEK
jgi:DUF438 domain-containing protein